MKDTTSFLLWFAILIGCSTLGKTFKICGRAPINQIKSRLVMHLGHDHSHGHTHDEDHDDDKCGEAYAGVPTSREFTTISKWGKVAISVSSPKTRIILVALLLVLPAVFRRKLTKFDALSIATITACLSSYDVAKKGTFNNDYQRPEVFNYFTYHHCSFS